MDGPTKSVDVPLIHEIAEGDRYISKQLEVLSDGT